MRTPQLSTYLPHPCGLGRRIKSKTFRWDKNSEIIETKVKLITVNSSFDNEKKIKIKGEKSDAQHNCSRAADCCQILSLHPHQPPFCVTPPFFILGMMFYGAEYLFTQFGSPVLALLPDGFFIFISSLPEHETEKKVLGLG